MVKWDEILTAKEASLMLGKNEKYVYILFKMNSNMLLEGSTALRGNTLLITKEGVEHLRAIHENGKKKNNLVIENDSKVLQKELVFN